MRAVFCFPLFFAVGLWADEAQDRAAIHNVIVAINNPAKRAGLFTRDADCGVDFDRLLDLHKRVWPLGEGIGIDETWTELTAPRVVSGVIRFITPDVAIVDGASTIVGAVTLAGRVPLLFVMKREGTEWRISVVRVVAPTSSPAPPSHRPTARWDDSDPRVLQWSDSYNPPSHGPDSGSPRKCKSCYGKSPS